jgi:type I restriction enzyme S subunit
VSADGRWQAYPEYKDSGVAWLGEIPAHWMVQKLKYISSTDYSGVDKHRRDEEEPVRLCNYVDVYYHDYITDDLELMEATASADEIGNFTLRESDVIITKDSETWDDIAVPAYVPSDLEGVLCGYHLALIRPDEQIVDGKYLFRSFSARGINDQFRVAANGITRYGLGKHWLNNSVFLIPPLPEQRAIAAFLDRETARIDALVAKQERLIELLQEKRAALISHAVTKGLDPDVPMKDSGIPWLREIPAHWRLLQLRRVIEKFVDYRGKTLEKVQDGIPLITARNIKNGVINFDLSQEFIREEDYDSWMVRGLPEVGDVLVTTEAPLGESAQIVDTRIALAQRIILLKAVKERITNNYLKYHFAASSGQGELWSHATGSTAIGIKAYHLRAILVTVPPIEEQENIAAHLDRETAKIDALIAKVQKMIERLQEYRTALISAAVTGKMDVRES